jgi:hypothetical protein
MLSRWQRNYIFEAIPTELAGFNVVKNRDGEIQAESAFPKMIVSVISEGVRVHFYKDRIRYQKRLVGGDKQADYWYGQIDRASFSIALEAYDKDDLGDIGRDLYLYLWSKELGLSWYSSEVPRMRLSKIFEPVYLPEIYDQRTGKNISRLIIDFWVEYEFSWMETNPLIRRFNYLLIKDELARVNVETYAKNSYGMSLKIVKL